MMKKILQNIGITLASILVSLGACEIVARLVLPPPMAVKVTQQQVLPSTEPKRDVHESDGNINLVIHWRGEKGVRLFPNVTGYIQNHSLSHQDVVIRVNSLGFRGEEVLPRTPGQFRILFMGDSITFGDYVDEKLTIPVLLQEKLRAKGYTDVVVMNAGLPGINFADQFTYYQEMYQTADPDLVLLGMYLNDAQDTQKFYAKTLRFPFSASRFLTWAVQKLQFVNSDDLFVKRRAGAVEQDWREQFRAGRDLKPRGLMLTNRDDFDFEIYNAHKDFGLGWSPTAWKQLAKIGKAFVSLVQQNGSKFAAFLFPVRLQIYCNEDVQSTYPQDEFKKLFDKLNVPNYDLLPALRQRATSISAKDLFYDHCHYRAEGNQIVADLLVDWLVKDSIVPKPK